MDYGVLPTFPDGRQHAPSDYEREKQQAFEAELQAAQQEVKELKVKLFFEFFTRPRKTCSRK